MESGRNTRGTRHRRVADLEDGAPGASVRGVTRGRAGRRAQGDGDDPLPAGTGRTQGALLAQDVALDGAVPKERREGKESLGLNSMASPKDTRADVRHGPWNPAGTPGAPGTGESPIWRTVPTGPACEG